MRHVFSRLGSDIYFPQDRGLRVPSGTRDHRENVERGACSFLRLFPPLHAAHESDPGPDRCRRTQIGLHLENSRSYETFSDEKDMLERYIGRPVTAVSKHGSASGSTAFITTRLMSPKIHRMDTQEWDEVFLGNLEDPRLRPLVGEAGLHVFPSAFWLEPSWRDTRRFPVKCSSPKPVTRIWYSHASRQCAGRY